MYWKTLVSLVLSFALCSCTGEPSEQKHPSEKKAAKEVSMEASKKPQGVDTVLAVVNGSEITRHDLDLAIRKLAGAEAVGALDEQATRKVLESMVMSRAISQLQQKDMTAEEQDEIAAEVAMFEEQLLVRKYLADHSKPQPVTMDAIQKYYDAHPELFGARKVKQYEMITTGRPLEAGERDDLLGKLNAPEQHEKWRNWAGELAGAGYPVVYRQGQDGDEEKLHPSLARTIASLSPGEAAKLVLVKDTPYLIRIADEREIPARPLSEVVDTIRKALVPQQLKQAIEQAGKEALAGAEVEYKTIPAETGHTPATHP